MNDLVKEDLVALPVGMTEFNALIETLKSSFTLPTLDEDSIRFAVAASIINTGPTVTHMPLSHFHDVLMAGAAKQIAGAVFGEIKQKQFAAEKAAKEAAALANVDTK